MTLPTAQPEVVQRMVVRPLQGVFVAQGAFMPNLCGVQYINTV